MDFRTLPVVFGQRDPRYANDPLGTSPSVTIGIGGCYVTSMTMVARYYGKHEDPTTHEDFTPHVLNLWFTRGNIYQNGDLLSDGALQQVFGDITLQEVDNYQNVPADLQKLGQLLSDQTLSVICELDLGNGNTHFVVALGTDGNDVQIANPWTGLVELLSATYGDAKTAILKFVVYKGNLPIIEVPVQTPEVVPPVITQPVETPVVQAPLPPVENPTLPTTSEEVAQEPSTAPAQPSAPIETPTTQTPVQPQTQPTEQPVIPPTVVCSHNALIETVKSFLQTHFSPKLVEDLKKLSELLSNL